MLYEYLNMSLGTKLLFEQKFTQEEMYRIFATFSINYVSNADQHSVLKLLLKGVSMNSLSMFLQALHIALDHTISLSMRKGTSWHGITFSGNSWQKKLWHL